MDRHILDSVCMSYRHDYGLLSAEEQLTVRLDAKQWLRAWIKELGFDIVDFSEGSRKESQ